MVKHKPMQEQPSDGEMTVVVFKLKGSNSTMQEGLRTIAASLKGIAAPTVVMPALPAPRLNGHAPASSPQQPALFDLDESDVETVDSESNELPVPDQTANGSKPKRKPPTLQLVKDLDLRPENKTSLRDFYAEKQPKTQHEQMAVFVYYLCNILEMNGVTPNHVFTCFDNVGKRPPNDLPQILRNCARKEGWIDTKDSSAIKIETMGVNMVKHDLPRKSE